MFVCNWAQIPPPTPKSLILTRIQKWIFFLTLLYGIFIVWSRPIHGISYLLSSILLFNAYRQLSYFSCVIHQLFCWYMCLQVLFQFAINLQNGNLSTQLSFELANKMFIISFSVFCFYFDFAAYKQYKAVAVQVKQEGQM